MSECVSESKRERDIKQSERNEITETEKGSETQRKRERKKKRERERERERERGSRLGFYFVEGEGGFSVNYLTTM